MQDEHTQKCEHYDRKYDKRHKEETMDDNRECNGFVTG